MAQRARPHRVEVKLTDVEHAALMARARAEGVPMATVLRSAIERVPSSPGPLALPTRARVLAQLAEAAEGGSVQAMTTLARELRLGGPTPTPKTGPVTRDELRAELRAVR